MTTSGVVQLSQMNTFDERVEIIMDELELAIQWDRPYILMVVYNSEYVRADAETALRNLLIERGQKVVHIQMDEAPTLDLIGYFQKFPLTPKHFFFVNGLNAQQEDNFARLNSHKDILINKKTRMIFWLTPKILADLAHLLPDFWESRHRVIEFLDVPRPEQILQTAIEFEWLGTGEYTDQFEDTEEKISLREMLLTELPENTESTSTRANLILTLGILNWRKGDFEKANELLQSAIKAAIRLEDKWFETECFNAIALVKFSERKYDEAIDAYKQAISIAPEQIYVWNNLGNLCLKINRNDEAMLAFQKALKHNTKDPIAWSGLGEVYYKIGYIDDSISAYRKAIEYAPLLSNPWIGLGDAYTSVGRDIDAINAYQKAIELNKQTVTPWLRIADIFCRQGRNRDAIKSYNRALLVDPGNPQIWNELGLVLLKANSFEDASQAFSKASELDRSFGWAYSNLAVAYVNLGRYHEAIKACQQSLEVFTEDNDKAMAWDRLANCYRAINDYDNAMRSLQMADCLNGRIAVPQQKFASDLPKLESAPSAESLPDSFPTTASQSVIGIEEPQSIVDTQEEKQIAPAWIFQTETWSQCNATLTTYSENEDRLDPDKRTTKELLMITKETPQPKCDFVPAPVGSEDRFPSDLLEEDAIAETQNPEVWNQKGNIHFQKGEYEEAITAYNKAIELDRSFGWPYSNLAFTYLTLGKYAEAILLYKKSASLLRHKEEQAAAWNSLGNIYRHLNDYEDALKAYQKADELDPQNAGKRDQMELAISSSNSENAQVWLELGNLFFKSASYSEAVNAYTQAVKMDPVSGWAHSNLAMSLAFQGRYREAVPIYLKSIELFTNDKDKATSWNRLGNVYRKLNDQDKALKAYQTAVILSKEKTNLLTRTRFTLLGNCFAS